MAEPAGDRAPARPIGADVAGGLRRARFEAAAVTVSDGVVDRLRGVCAAVDTTVATRLEAGRDWWPVTVGWALAGEAAGLAAAVARPADAAQVAAVLAVCHDAGVPVTAAGGHSGVSGGAVPVFGGVVLEMTALAGIVAVDDHSLLVDVRAGTFGDALETELRATFGLTIGHWPQSVALSTVGGWVACRGAGQYSTRYGKIEDMVAGLEVALADGRLIKTGGMAPRAAVGPDLTALFLGSEGTLGVVTEARLRAHPVPPVERRAAFGFAAFADGLDACRAVLRRGATPAVLRLYDTHESRSAYRVDANVLIILDEGDPAIVESTMAIVAEEAAARRAEHLAEALVQAWYDKRQDVSALEVAVRAGLTVDTIEVAARWSVLPSLYQDVIEAVGAVDGTLLTTAHQSHAYPDGGCLYFTFVGVEGQGVADSYYCRVWDVVMAITIAKGAAISHHHGIGLNRARHLAPALGPGFEVLASLKDVLDPRGVLNPGKLGLPSPFGEVPWP